MPTGWLKSFNKHWLKAFCFTWNLNYSDISCKWTKRWQMECPCPPRLLYNVLFSNVWMHRRCAVVSLARPLPRIPFLQTDVIGRRPMTSVCKKWRGGSGLASETRCAARRRSLQPRYTEGGRFYSSLQDYHALEKPLQGWENNMPTDWLSSINKHWLKTFCFTLNLYYSYIMAYVRGHFELQIDEKMAVRVSVSSVIIQCPFFERVATQKMCRTSTPASGKVH